MNHNKWKLGLASIIFLVSAAITLGPLRYTSRSSADSLGTRNIIPLTPTQIATHNEIVRLDQAAAAALDAGQYARAEAEAKQSVSLGHDSGIAQELLASSLDAQGKTQEALQAYKVIADRGGDSCDTLLPYARLLLKTGHWAEAVAAYNKQLPGLSDENLMTANSHFSPTVPQPKELATAIHIAQGLTYAGASWGKHSQDDKALKEFQQALALEPNSALANLFYGRKLQQLGRKAEAQAFFKKASKNGNGDVKTAAKEALTQ